MKESLKKYILLIAVIGLFVLCKNQSAYASDDPPYVIDQAPLTPPEFDSYTVQEVSTLSEFTNIMGNPNQTNVIVELQNDLQLTSQVSIQGNKAINLNGQTLSGASGSRGNVGSLFISNESTTENFKIYNGHMSGGPTSTSVGIYTTNINAFVNVDYRKQDNVVLEDITYDSPSNGGTFFQGLSCNVFSLGTNRINTYTTNIRAGNMTFLGDFYGTAFGVGLQGFWGQGNGGLNLSFDGYEWGFRNPYNKKGNPNSAAMSRTVGDRRLYIAPESHVYLKNTNNNTSGLFATGYNNNIANFSTLNVDGTLIADAQGTSLRTTASATDTGIPYLNQAGTYNGRANVNVNEGAIFRISSVDTTSKFGALFTYHTNLYTYKPKVFDMRYNGQGNFFFSWGDHQLYSSVYLYDLNIGVWSKEQMGIGDPEKVWADVASLSIVDFSSFWGKNNGKITSSDPNLASTFQINNYSRISNDINIPKLLPDSQYITNDNVVFVNNGGTTFSGSSEYFSPLGIEEGVVPVDATVTLKINDQTYTTKTNDSGEWSFDTLGLSQVKGGTEGSLNLTDTDERTAPEIKVLVKDTIPPIATPKLIEVPLGNASALSNPKDGIETASDETTPTDDLTYSFETSEINRNRMVNRSGVYTVDIKVSDEAGNSTVVSAPVIVYPPNHKPTNSFVTGNDFEVDYAKWVGASETERKHIVMEDGDVKGYEINGNTVTEINDDPSKITINIPDERWEVSRRYPITVQVGNYQTTIYLTLLQDLVEMTVKYVYEGTDNPIFSDLASKKPVDNNKSLEVTSGQPLNEVLNKEFSDGEIVLDYDGYTAPAITDYKIYQNGLEVTTTPTTVPEENFTVVYSYEGQLTFQTVAKKLDFGTIEITGNNSEEPLSNTSDTSISILNTIQTQSWQLSASMANGIKNSSDNQTFLGAIVYKKSNGDEIVIGPSSTKIEEQANGTLFSQVPLKNTDHGLFLHQDVGNLKGDYSGEMVWSLEDVP